MSRACRTQVRESDPRDPAHSVYYAQQDFLSERVALPGCQWNWTAWRPPSVIGFAQRAPLSVLAAIGCHACLARSLQQPLHFPGGSPPLAKQICDARLLAEAFEWAATEGLTAAANTSFNITNGDEVIWTSVYPSVAAHFGMVAGAPQPISLHDTMPTEHNEALWGQIAADHGLVEPSLDALVGDSWAFTDASFRGWGTTGSGDGDHPPEHPPMAVGVMMSVVKLHEAGFTRMIDSVDCVVHWLGELQERRILPR